MQSKLEREEEDLEKNHSDSDDWTLVSSPEQSKSSPAGPSTPEHEDHSHNVQATSISPISTPSSSKGIVSKKARKEQSKQASRAHKDNANGERRQAEAELEMRASGSQDADDEEDDGLIEIDLNTVDEVRNSKCASERVASQAASVRPRKLAKSVEFAPTLVHQQTVSSVPAKTRDCSTQHTQLATAAASAQTLTTAELESCEHTANNLKSSALARRTAQGAARSVRQGPPSSSAMTFKECIYTSAILVLVTLIYAKLTDRMIDDKSQRRFFDLIDSLRESGNRSSEPFDLFYISPEDTAYVHLKKLDSELEACIRDKGYGWLKDVDEGRLSHPKRGENPSGGANEESPHSYKTRNQARQQQKQAPKYKPFRGVVCYERESEWRERFKKLKEEFNFDLRKLAKQGYKRLASNLLTGIHTELRFSLLLNQLEYLDYLDEQRRRQEIERLKAENLELRKRLMAAPSSRASTSGGGGGGEAKVGSIASMAQASSKSLMRLESENGKLRREIEALKANLVEKTGTVYIKQSLELEKCERENNALRQFHQQVAHEVSKALKQLDLSTVDAAALLNDHESLSSQLALTRGYLSRLGDELGRLIARSKNAERESEFYRVLLDTLESTPRAKQITEESAAEPESPTGHAGLSGIDDDDAAAIGIHGSEWHYNNQRVYSLGRLADEVHSLAGAEAEQSAEPASLAAAFAENRSTTLGVGEQLDGCDVAHPSTAQHQCDAPPTEPVGPVSQAGATPTTNGASDGSTRGDWSMRRARLRERLRKSSGIDILEKQIDRLIDQSKYLNRHVAAAAAPPVGSTQQNKHRHHHHHHHHHQSHDNHHHPYRHHNQHTDDQEWQYYSKAAQQATRTKSKTRTATTQHAHEGRRDRKHYKSDSACQGSRSNSNSLRFSSSC